MKRATLAASLTFLESLTIVLIAALLTGGHVSAQALYGSIVGTVVDSTGAVVPGCAP